MGELGTWLEATDTTGASGSELLAQKREALARLAGGWLTSRLAGILTEKNIAISDLKISAEDFAEFLQLIYTGAINSANAQKLLLLMVETGMDPSHLLEEHNLGQNMNEDELRAMIARLIEENPDKVAQIKAGKVAVIKWFVGSIMKATKGKANPETAEQMIQKCIEASQ
jgi:aspartyl-tRNA(Asn)/glutamyl-tRNA(Gln) amidotransferase subunit B